MASAPIDAAPLSYDGQLTEAQRATLRSQLDHCPTKVCPEHGRELSMVYLSFDQIMFLCKEKEVCFPWFRWW